jgi:ferredoxin
MTLVRFVSADGTGLREVDAAPGQRLLDVAQEDGQPLEGTCEGQMACSTCHVVVAAEDWAKLPPASEEEDDLLDLAAHVTRPARSCSPTPSTASPSASRQAPTTCGEDKWPPSLTKIAIGRIFFGWRR